MKYGSKANLSTKKLLQFLKIDRKLEIAQNAKSCSKRKTLHEIREDAKKLLSIDYYMHVGDLTFACFLGGNNPRDSGDTITARALPCQSVLFYSRAVIERTVAK